MLIDSLKEDVRFYQIGYDLCEFDSLSVLKRPCYLVCKIYEYVVNDLSLIDITYGLCDLYFIGC